MLSIVLPTRNADGHIAQQLESLFGQLGDEDEVIVSDNGSDDATMTVVRAAAVRAPCEIRISYTGPKPNINKARNVGIAAARSEKILLCDADDRVNAGWAAALSAALDFSDGAGGYCRTALNPPGFASGMRYGPRETELPKALDFLPFAVGANAAFWKSVWEALGGFCETYKRGNTDVEFFWRMQLCGYELSFAPSAVVDYRYRTSAIPAIRQTIRFGVSDVHLYRDFKVHGLPRAACGWRRDHEWFMRNLALLRNGAPGIGELCRPLTLHTGRVLGCLLFRAWFP